MMTTLLLAVIYLAFISLGLPDALLGAAWPSMYEGLGAPVSSAGVISMIIALGTVVSSLESDRVTKKLGAGKVTALSVAMTAGALWGFSVSGSFWQLCLWAVPYGLGAGSVDAALNNYVAVHFAARHMSWLHCMWGVGASIGPYIMGRALVGGWGWPIGYRAVAFFQIFLAVALVCTLPLWKAKNVEKRAQADTGGVNKPGDRKKRREKPDKKRPARERPYSLREVLTFPGAKEVVAAFFCYSAVEQTAALWAASYLVLHNGLRPEQAAGYAALFYLGMTAGRAASGFVADKAGDKRMVEAGLFIAGAGALAMLIREMAPVALILLGLGCAPVYPSLVHATPERFGAERSQAVIGVEMAGAYVGTMALPPLFGLLTRFFSVALLPVYLALFALLVALFHRWLTQKTCE